MMIFDMDGVLVDLIGGASEQHGRDYLSEIKVGCYDLPEGFWDKPIDWEALPPTQDFFWMSRYFSDAVAVTLSPSLEISIAKLKWLERYAPELDLCFCDRSLLSGILLDDCDANIRDYPGPSILVPRKWNSLYREAGYE